MNKRCGELTTDEINRIVAVLTNPLQFKIPGWFLNRQKGFKDGKHSHAFTNDLARALRDDLERMKRCRHHRGLRHFWGLRVRGQHTKTTGRGRWMMTMKQDRGKQVRFSKNKLKLFQFVFDKSHELLGCV